MPNDNAVNIDLTERRYHHGDLRGALIREGLDLLRRRNAETLSLREAARNLGVSATSIYRHFPDKAAYLSALADAGFAMLAAEQGRASGSTQAARFAATGQAYVRFAIANPSLFRLMFSSFSPKVRPDQSFPEGSAAWMLKGSVAALLGPGASEGEKFVAMLRAWSLVHGLAMLILDGQIDYETAAAHVDAIVSDDSLGLPRETKA